MLSIAPPPWPKPALAGAETTGVSPKVTAFDHLVKFIIASVKLQELWMADLSNVRVNGERLWDSLMEMAKIGATPKGGCKRLTLTDLDKQGRELFRGWCEAAGCAVKVDEMGNMFARRPGAGRRARPGDDGQPSRHAADRRQVRRRARRARRARSRALAQRSQDQDPPPDRGRQLDQRGRLALRAGDGLLGRVRRRL